MVKYEEIFLSDLGTNSLEKINFSIRYAFSSNLRDKEVFGITPEEFESYFEKITMPENSAKN